MSFYVRKYAKKHLTSSVPKIGSISKVGDDKLMKKMEHFFMSEYRENDMNTESVAFDMT